MFKRKDFGLFTYDIHVLQKNKLVIKIMVKIHLEKFFSAFSPVTTHFVENTN